MCNLEVFPSVRTLWAKGQLAVQLGKELPRGKQKLLLLLISHIKLESFHLLQVSNTICCLKGRWHWSSEALRACLINQTWHQQVWNVSVSATIPFFFFLFFYFKPWTYFDLIFIMKWIISLPEEAESQGAAGECQVHNTSVFIPSHRAVISAPTQISSSVTLSKAWAKESSLKCFHRREPWSPWGMRSSKKIILSIKNKNIDLLLAHTVAYRTE